MTYDEAKRKLAADGYVGEPTPEILRQYGWTPSDPLAGVTITVSRTKDQLRDDLALLMAEAEANKIPKQVLDGVLKFAATAFKLMA